MALPKNNECPVLIDPEVTSVAELLKRSISLGHVVRIPPCSSILPRPPLVAAIGRYLAKVPFI